MPQNPSPCPSLAAAQYPVRRDRRGKMNKAGCSWEIGKGFARTALVGPEHPTMDIGYPDQGTIKLKLNGALRQEGDLNPLIRKGPDVITYLSDDVELAAGDVVLLGTPASVGPIHKDDDMERAIEGLD
ncbi:fumarylacetoacetate hydrolase family protein [Roseobacter sp.]|uniref:fumarylacetoacetate hydrolase family protein n=1 Tax=Roseobacter sp. TaxID=1907202 RepID=UPI00296675D5|nr:fumarylacetoacetate hydrolase family protein [Roseobacter sp.]MDW3181664.1 fumarylacetoacetate hydrolase family protein [Roseobacter sp.]